MSLVSQKAVLGLRSSQPPVLASTTCSFSLTGLFLSTTPGLNVVTVMFSSGVGIEVKGNGRLLSLAVLLPEKFLHHTQGLLGVMNNRPQDDLTLRNGTILQANTSSPEQLFAFGADCK